MQSSASRRLAEAAQRAPHATTYTHGYPPHFQYANLQQQVSTLGQRFPELKTGAAYEYIGAGLPKIEGCAAESWQALPRRSAVASNYQQLVKRTLTALSRAGLTSAVWAPEHYECLKPYPQTEAFLEQIGKQFRGDIIFVPVQFGQLHAGKSVRDVRLALLKDPGQFALGVFEIGAMLLSNPCRLTSPRDLAIDCVGDRYLVSSSGPDGERSPYFEMEKSTHSNHSYVCLRNRFSEEHDTMGRFGAATGFLIK